MTVEEFLGHFQMVRPVKPDTWTADCPTHASRSQRSLSITRDGDKLLVHCFGGCRTEAVLAAAGLAWADLFEKKTVDIRNSFSRRALRRRSPLDEARHAIILEARRQRKRHAKYADLVAESESIRHGNALVAEARQIATALGDCPAAWDLLERAADLECRTRSAEAHLDDGGPLL